MALLSKLFGDANAKYIRSLQPIVAKINALEKDFEKLTDEELKKKTHDFRNRLQASETLDDILPEAFAAVREASKRTLGQRHFDVQLMGGIVLHQGKIAEMRTGEGKTLVATLPAYLNSLEGRGVHIVSVNDFLVRRDAAWMGQIYNALGASVGCVNHDASYIYDPSHATKTEDVERDTEGGFKVVHEFLRPVTKKEAYEANITYGTNNEYGFDYLRDNMAHDLNQMVQIRGSTQTPTAMQSVADQRGNYQRESAYQSASISDGKSYAFAIIDEVDSILIDEARTPLIISAPDEDSGKLYETFAGVVPRLKENEDYNVDEKRKAVSVTESGIEKIEKILGLGNIYEAGGVRYVHHLEQALKAHVLFKKDRDYVVKDGEIIIVDEFTGRLMPGRRWSEGLHQAVEAKEGVSVQKESRTLATITFQNYFRLYKKLAGMTGTAQTSAEEFHKVYKLDVVVVPTNKPAIRKDLPDRIYKTEEGKFRAVAAEIKERYEKGQPVLVGTVSIEKNELLSLMLQREGVPHNVLNAKNHEKEAELHAQAGRLGGVTVATNMAGRGVDIILGGNPQNDPEQSRRVRELGGLHVIGTERHEARRIDNQLRGRAGRQGDSGSSQFFVSLSDDVIRIFGGERIKNMMDRLGFSEDEAIENKIVSNVIEQAQAKIEGHNFDTRKYVLEYDDVMNKHREATYRLRKQILFSKESKELVLDYFNDFIEKLVDFHYSKDTEPNIKEVEETVSAILNFKFSILNEIKDREELKDYIIKAIEEKYGEKEKEVGEDMRRLEKIVLLRTIDELWMDHIEAMDHLKQSVQLRGYGQRDPLVEYKIEGQGMFQQLQDSIKVQVVNLIFKVSFTDQPRPTKMEEHRPEAIHSHKHQPVINEPAHRDGEQKIGRNDPCWCGSGKKFKKCHGA